MGWKDAPIVEEGASWKSAPPVDAPVETNAKEESKPEKKGFFQFVAEDLKSAPKRAGAAAAGLNRFAMGVAGMPVDVASIAYRGVRDLPFMKHILPELPPQIGGSEWIADQAAKVGLGVKPQDPTEQMYYNLGQYAPFGPKTAVAATAAENYVPGSGDVVAIAPSLWGGIRSMMAPGKPWEVRERIDRFKESTGQMPTAGQALGSTLVQSAEAISAKTPGGREVMLPLLEKQQQGMAARVKTGVEERTGGAALQSGAEGYAERTKAIADKLYQGFANKLGKNADIAPTNTLKTLSEVATPTKGWENTTSPLVNKTLSTFYQGILKDLSGTPGETKVILGSDGKPIHTFTVGGTPGKEKIPFEVLQSVRTKVADQWVNSLKNDVSTAEAKRVYGALSEDMKALAKARGAEQEFATATQYWQTRMDRIEGVLKYVSQQKTPEGAFKYVLPKNQSEVTLFKEAMYSLKPDERKIVADAIQNRLGTVKAGLQDEAGGRWSSESFLTHWNQINPELRAMIWPDAGYRRHMESIAKTAAEMRSAGKLYSNPSGTTGLEMGFRLASAPIISIVTGNAAWAMGAALSVASGYKGSKVLADPKFVEWLAQSPKKLTAAEQAAHLAKLSVMTSQTKDPDVKAAYEEMLGKNQ